MKLHRSVLLFTGVALLFTVSAYLREPILSLLASIPAGASSQATVAAFDSSREQPIAVSAHSGGADQRASIAFRFRPTALDGHPNVAQTSDVNAGVRFELHGSTLSVVYPGKAGLSGKVLADDIQTGRWYAVTAEFQSGDFLRASCDGGEPIHESSLGETRLDRVLVGQGFSDERKFQGQIADFSFRAQPRLGIAKAEVALLALKLLLIAVGCLAIWQMARSHEEPHGMPSPIEPPLAGAIDPLLTLRAFALMQVLVGHLFMCVFVSYRFPGRLQEEPWLSVLAPAPWAGVWVFFVLSGYLMGKGFFTGRYTLAPQRVYRYLSNRFLRIVPVYCSAVLLVAAATSPEIFQLKHLPLLGSILIFDYNGQQRINPIGALWSVSTEVQFYALVPLLYFGLSRFIGERHERALKLSGVVLVGGLVTRLLVKEVAQREGVFAYIYAPMLANLDLFVLGMLTNPLIAALRSKPWVVRYATAPSALALIGVGYLVSSYFGAGVITGDVDLPRLMIYGPTVAAPITVLIIGCCELGSASQASSGFVRRALLVGSGLGVLAYPIYVWHEPILLTLRRLAPTPLSMGDAIKYSLIATFLTWTVAEFIYRHIELPTEKLKKKRQLPPPPADEADEASPVTLKFPLRSDDLPKSKAA